MKFNQTSTVKTVNKSGHSAYKMEDKALLVTQVLTSFFGEQKYYGDNTPELIETAKRVIKKEPKFVSNLAQYARKEMHLRSVSHYLAALVAYTPEAKPLIRDTVYNVIERVDDITEILSAYISIFDKPIPNGLKKALNQAMNNFNSYQFSKYNSGNKTVKLRDVLKLCHTRPTNDEQSKIFKAILNDTLETAERWETELSAHGNNKETWDKLIANNKIGYMAALRNLRNMLNANANIEPILTMLRDPIQVAKSKQLPFRFYSAYRELQNIPNYSTKIANTLEDAIEASVTNLPLLPGKTIIGIDVSRSMRAVISQKSTVTCCEIAAIIGAIANKLCENVIIYTFDTKIQKYTIIQRNGILATAKTLQFNGGGTNVSLPIREMCRNNIVADRLIMLSDNEINSPYHGFTHTCQTFADQYRREINPDLWIHAIDLVGYGTQQFIGTKTNIIAGWSERILEFITLAENGFDNQVSKIENYK